MKAREKEVKAKAKEEKKALKEQEKKAKQESKIAAMTIDRLELLIAQSQIKKDEITAKYEAEQAELEEEYKQDIAEETANCELYTKILDAKKSGDQAGADAAEQAASSPLDSSNP